MEVPGLNHESEEDEDEGDLQKFRQCLSQHRAQSRRQQAETEEHQVLLPEAVPVAEPGHFHPWEEDEGED